MPVRIGKTGDIHLTEGPRFEDTKRCAYWVADDGRAQGVQLWSVDGDLAGTTVPHRQTTLERNALDDWFLYLAETAPVVVLYGNHDAAGDLDRIGKLKGKHPIHLFDRPGSVELAGVRVLAFPYPHKMDWLALAGAAGTIDEQLAAIQHAIRTLFEGWKAEVEIAHRRGMPVVFSGHAAIEGSVLAGGEVLAPGGEIELPVAVLQALGCDFASTNHIHMGQEYAPGIWSAGSPNRSKFDETDEKGYLIVDVEAGMPPLVHRRLTPARRFVTVDAKWAQTPDGTWGWERDDVDAAALDGAEVRVRVAIPEEAWSTCPVADLEAEFGALAVDVQVDRSIVPTVRTRSEEIRTARTTADKVNAWWDSLGETGPAPEQRERALRWLPRIEAKAAA
ncbi:MAG: hypothetical protein KIT14_22635 [bacterium]|nr:hypothetical protein [bacterium]